MITWDFNELAQKVTFKTTVNEEYKIHFTHPNSIGQVIGFDTDITAFNGSTYTGQVLDCMETSRVYISSRALSSTTSYKNIFKTLYMRDYTGNIIESVPVPCEPTPRIIYTPNYPKPWPTGSDYPDSWDFSLLDDRGNPLVLNDPVHGWQIEIVILY